MPSQIGELVVHGLVDLWLWQHPFDPWQWQPHSAARQHRSYPWLADHGLGTTLQIHDLVTHGKTIHIHGSTARILGPVIGGLVDPLRWLQHSDP